MFCNGKKMKKNTLLALVSIISAITLFATQVKAEEKEYVERFSIEVGTGVNIFLPFFHAKVGYLLPTEKNNIQIKGEYSFINVSITSLMPRTASIEVNYYLNEKSLFNPFFNIGLWGGGNFEGKDIYGRNVKAAYSLTALSVGIGTDLLISKNFGFSTQINVLPVAWDHQINTIKGGFNIRPEVNLKLLF